jgi:hypothetical protein
VTESVIATSDLFEWSDQAILLWGSIATILLLLGAWFARGSRFVQWFFRRLERRLRGAPPRDTMRVVPDPPYVRWSEGSVAGRPASHLSGTWLVTNAMADTQLVVAGATLRLPLLKRLRLEREQSRLDSPLTLAVPPRGTGRLHGSFWLVPPLAKAGRDFRAELALMDQFENRRRIKVRFTAPRQPSPTPERQREQLSTIMDPIEQAVASVLQAEIARYRTNGRREGGFGSVASSHGGRELRGVGGDVREVATARNQVIVPDPDEARVESDNKDALVALYQGLATHEERERFRSALLARVTKDSIYTPIAYLPMLVALDLGFAPQFFSVARETLLGDEEYGFSNCLMLLDGLLRLRHPDFPVELLDEIENLVHGTGEHPFAIPERIAAIRADRLRQ